MLPELAVNDSGWPPDAICDMWDAAGRQLQGSAKVVQAAASCQGRARAAADAPGSVVSVIALEPDGHHSTSSSGHEEAGPLRAPSKARHSQELAGLQAGLRRRSSGSSSKPRTSVLQNGLQFGSRSLTAARTVPLSVRRTNHRSDAVHGSREYLSLV